VDRRDRARDRQRRLRAVPLAGTERAIFFDNAARFFRPQRAPAARRRATTASLLAWVAYATACAPSRPARSRPRPRRGAAARSRRGRCRPGPSRTPARRGGAPRAGRRTHGRVRGVARSGRPGVDTRAAREECGDGAGARAPRRGVERGRAPLVDARPWAGASGRGRRGRSSPPTRAGRCGRPPRRVRVGAQAEQGCHPRRVAVARRGVEHRRRAAVAARDDREVRARPAQQARGRGCLASTAAASGVHRYREFVNGRAASAWRRARAGKRRNAVSPRSAAHVQRRGIEL
jgi:hypothetical protein